MNILLINPSLIQADIGHYSRTIEKNRGVYPPLGLSYIASAMLTSGHQVNIVDCDTDKNYMETIYKECVNSDVVGFYTMTWTYREAVRILWKIKRVNPKIMSICGGPNATSFPYNDDFDYTVAGEGEEAVIELLNHRTSTPRPLITDLDKIVFPAWDLLKVDRYRDIFSRRKRFATMIASRGCPFNCIFCDRKNRMGNRWRVRSVENVIKEIELLYDKYNIREIMFYDDNFVFDKNWIYEFCSKLTRKIDWECRTRVDTVDLPLLKAMKEAGCYRIRYGMEGGNQEMLRILKKGITVEQIQDCAKATKEAGIEIFAYFMMGSPYENKGTLEDTLSLALEIDADFTVFSKTILIIGSELFDWAVKNGQIRADYWERFLAGEETDPAPALYGKEVDDFIKYSYKKIYSRPKQLLNLTKLGVRNLCKLL